MDDEGMWRDGRRGRGEVAYCAITVMGVKIMPASKDLQERDAAPPPKALKNNSCEYAFAAKSLHACNKGNQHDSNAEDQASAPAGEGEGRLRRGTGPESE